MQKLGLLGCVGLLLLVGVVALIAGASGYNHLNTLSNDVGTANGPTCRRNTNAATT